jgi:hypothetical protein
MKVKDLIELLSNLPGEHEVILSKDSEGNEFSPLADHGLQMYVSNSTWSGDIYSEEDVEDYRENAVVLWPTN